VRIERIPLALALGLALSAIPASAWGLNKSRKPTPKRKTARDLVHALTRVPFVLSGGHFGLIEKGTSVQIDHLDQDMRQVGIAYKEGRRSHYLAWLSLAELQVPRAAGTGTNRARPLNKAKAKAKGKAAALWASLNELLVPWAEATGTEKPRWARKAQPETAQDVIAQLKRTPFVLRDSSDPQRDGRQVWIKYFDAEMKQAGVATAFRGSSSFAWVNLAQLEIVE
jgi:hypothetical protein